MLLSSALLALIVAAGVLVSYLYAPEMPLAHRLGFGAVSGMAAAGLFSYVVAHIGGIELAAWFGCIVAATLAVALASASRVRRRAVAEAATAAGDVAAAFRQPSLRTAGPLLWSLAMVALIALAFERVIVIEPAGVSTGYVNNVGDLPFHIHVAASFAFGGNFPPMDPTFAGSGFAYPYMADFVTAMFLALGAPLEAAFMLPNVVLALALVANLHRFTALLTSDRVAALVAPLLVLFSGGLGWMMLFDQLRAGEQGIVGLLGALPQDYTIAGDSAYRWGNSITTLLVTQRSLLFGVPLALMVFCLLWQLIHSPPRHVASAAGRPFQLTDVSPRSVAAAVRERPQAVAAGILTGMLPLVHAHSFVVVVGTAFLLGLLFRQWREGRWLPWAIYVVAALSIALPEIWWSTRDSLAHGATFFGLEIGWDRGDLDPVTFWLLNTGLFIPLTAAVLLVPALRRRLPAGLVLFCLPFLVWFVMPNVVKLAPWVWDNIKVLYYWYLGFVPLAALAVAWLLRAGPALRVAGMAALLSLTLAGALDVWRVISGQTLYREFDAAGVAIADQVLDGTPPRSVVLHAPTWNTPLYLTGRQSVMGYTGHMWAHGYDYLDREADVAAIYAGAADAAALLARHGVDYVVVGPHERNQGPVDDAFFSHYTEVAAADEYRLFQVAP